MRLSLRILLIAGTALVLILAAAVFARRELVEAIAEWQLQAAGFPEAAVSVAEVAGDQLLVSNLTLGPLRAEQVTLRYRPMALLRGELVGVEIGSLAYDLALPGVGREAGGDFELPALPPIRIESGRLNLTSPQVKATLDFEAEAAQDAAGLIEGRASFSGRSDLGEFEGELAAAFAGLQPERLDLQLRSKALKLLGETLALEPFQVRLTEGVWSADAALSGAGLQAQLSLRTETLALPAGLQLSASGELAADSPAWARLGLPPPERGRLEIGLDLKAEADLPEDLPESPAAWLKLATASGLSGGARLELVETHWPGLPRPASLALPLKLESLPDGLRLALPAALDLRGLPDLSPLAGDVVVATDLLKALAGATQLKLEGAAGGSPTLTITPLADGGLRLDHHGRLRVFAADKERAALSARSRVSVTQDLESPAAEVEELDLVIRDVLVAGEDVVEARITGRAAGSLTALNARGDLKARLRNARLDDFRFREVGLEAAFLLAAEGDQVVAEITETGRLAWSGGVTGGQIRLPAKHALTLSRLNLQRRGPALTYGAKLDPGALSLGVPQADGEQTELQARFAPLEVTGGWSEDGGHDLTAEIPIDEVTVPKLELVARGLSVRETYQPTEDRAELELKVKDLRHTGETPLFVPLALEGRLDHRRAKLAFSGQAATKGGRPLAKLEGWHDLEGEKGSARLHLAEDLLAGGPLPLRELAPVAPDFTLTRGEVTASADLSWQGAELKGTARAILTALDVDGPDLKLKGLETTLAFDRLFPPRSEPGQRLRAGGVTYFEPLQDVSAVFAVGTEADGSLAIDIERAQARSQLGPLTVVEGRAVPQRDSYRLTLQIAELDLARLSESAAIEGLSGEGQLGGLIPLEIEGDRIRIRGARLTNLDQGVLKFRSEAAAQALAAGGEPVTLMLQALEDFRYEELKLEAESGDTQELELFVTTLGQNPKVLEGHPFRFNIRLTSNLPQLVEALRQGSGLTQGILGKLWKFQP